MAKTFNFKIKGRWDDRVLFTAKLDISLQTASAKIQLGAAVKIAVGERADLSGADLSGADLRSANLRRADLSDANLRSAYLSGADLSGADLRSAYLRSADLSGADLSGADLKGTVLDPTTSIAPIEDTTIETDGMIVQGPWVYGWRTVRSQHCGSTTYAAQEAPYVAPQFSADTGSPCHPGIYLAGKAYLAENYPNVPIVPCRCLRSDLVRAGDKYRCKRLWILANELQGVQS